METRKLTDRVLLCVCESESTSTGTKQVEKSIGGAWAKVEIKAGSLREDATKENSKVKLIITVRTHQKFKNVSVITFDGEKYKVTSMPPINRRSRWLTFEAETSEA